MTKKHRLSFSAVSVDTKKVEQKTGHAVVQKTLDKQERKGLIKSSTYQYKKKRFRSGGRTAPFDRNNKSNSGIKIPSPEGGGNSYNSSRRSRRNRKKYDGHRNRGRYNSY